MAERAPPDGYDVAVVGAGVVGAACALACARRGLSVVVLERATVAAGTTGAGEGNVLVSDKPAGPELDLALLSSRLWAGWVAELADRYGDVEWEPKGGLVVARTAEELSGLHGVAGGQAAAGVDVEHVAPEGLAEWEPLLRADLAGGVAYRQDAQVQPARAAAVLLRAARDAGACVRTRTAVLGLRAARGVAPVGIDTSVGTVEAAAVVDAAGVWAGEVAALAGAPVPVSPRRGFVLVTEPVPPLVRHKVYASGYLGDVARDSAGLRHSPVVEQTRGGPILVGATRELVGFDVLATGAHDRMVPFPGWDLPGVVTAGCAQALLHGQGMLLGHRVLVAGTGPFLLVVAAGLAAAGADVAAVVEANDPLRWWRRLPAAAGTPRRLAEAAGLAAALARHRVPYWPRRAVTAVESAAGRLRATVEPVDAGWRVRPGRRSTLDVDTVCIGHGFTPAAELGLALGCGAVTDPRDGNLVVAVDDLQHAGVPRVFAAGEITGIGGAHEAMTEGTLAGAAAAAEVAGLDPADVRQHVRSLLARRRRERRFADALHAVHSVHDGWLTWLTDDTVLCRCEEVTVGRARADIADLGADDARSLKLLSRVGMGLCQGRICGWPASRLLAAETGRRQDLTAFANRPLARPVPLWTLAAEWSER